MELVMHFEPVITKKHIVNKRFFYIYHYNFRIQTHQLEYMYWSIDNNATILWKKISLSSSDCANYQMVQMLFLHKFFIFIGISCILALYKIVFWKLDKLQINWSSIFQSSIYLNFITRTLILQRFYSITTLDDQVTTQWFLGY